MAVQVNAMISIQGRDGLAYGYAHTISPEEIVFQVGDRVQIGEELPWRLELPGYPETAMGMLRVERTSPAKGGQWPTFHARITTLGEEDREIMEGWMEDHARGGTSRRLERDPQRFVDDMFSTSRHKNVVDIHKVALERIAKREAWRRKMFKKKGKDGWAGDDADPFNLASESDAAASADAQVPNAILQAIRAASTPDEGDPTPSPREEPAAAVKPASKRASSGADFQLDSSEVVPRLTVSWPDLEAYGRDWTRSLKDGALMAPLEGFQDQWGPVKVELLLPGGGKVSCDAKVVTAVPGGTGLALDLKASARRLLSLEAED